MTVLTNLKALSVSVAEQTAGNASFEDITGVIQSAIVNSAEMIQQLNRINAILTAANSGDTNITAINTILTALA
jgi:hypothetical protein